MKLDKDLALHLYEAQGSDAGNWNTTYEDIARYFMPQRVGFTGEKSPGEEKTQELRNSIGCETLEDLTNYVASVTTPAGMDQYSLRFRDDDLNEIRTVKEWLQNSTELMHQEMRESNCEAEEAEFYRDYCGLGTSSMQCFEKKDRKGDYAGLAFKALNIRGLRAMENEDGELDLTFYAKKLTAKAFRQQFENDAKANQAALPDVDDTNWNKEYTLLHVVWPRDDEDVDDAAYAFEDVPSDKLPYGSMWINVESKALVKEGGYYEPCRTIARWYRNVDTWNGYSPALLAKPDVKTLNEVDDLELDAWEKSIDPTIITESENAQTDINLAAGSIITVDNVDGIKPLVERTNWEASFQKTEQREARVRRLMFTDLIREPTGDSGQKTAYEIARRIERANRILGQAMSRLRAEYIRWKAQRIFSIMYRNDRFEELPADLEDRDIEIDVRFVSPIAISQASAKLDNIDNLIMRIAQVAEMQSPQDPSQAPIWDWFDDDGWIKVVEDTQNTPASIIKDKEVVKKIREAREAAQQQAAMLERAEKASTAISNVGSGAGEAAGQEMYQSIKGAAGG